MEATKDKIVEDIGAHELFQFLGRVNSPSNVRNLSTCDNFEFFSTTFRNSMTSKKMYVHSNAPRIAPKHAWRAHSQCIIFYRQFENTHQFPSAMPSDVSNTPPNWSIVRELFTAPQRNVRPRIDNPNASASKINIEGNALPTQVTEGHGLSPANLGNEHFSLDNAVETSSL